MAVKKKPTQPVKLTSTAPLPGPEAAALSARSVYPQLNTKAGYDATASAGFDGPTVGNASANLYVTTFPPFYLWVYEVQASFGLSGSTGQSQMLREFFPHNINDVTLTVTGQCANTTQYNKLAQFVRTQQWLALKNISNGTPSTALVALQLNSTYDGKTAPSVPKTPTYKGPHRPWLVTGYITSIAAGATAHEVAPEFTFGFEVVTANDQSGIWSDETVQASQLKGLLNLLGVQLGMNAPANSTPPYVQDPVMVSTPAAPTKPSNKGLGHAKQNSNWATAAAGAQFGTLS